MPGMRFLLPVLLVLAGASVPTRAAYGWPVDGAAVVRRFDPPPAPWLAGHRGVDLAAAPGGVVRSAGPGRSYSPVTSRGGAWSASRIPAASGPPMSPCGPVCGPVWSSRPGRRSAPLLTGTRAVRRRPACTGGCGAATNILIRLPCWGSAACACARCDPPGRARVGSSGCGRSDLSGGRRAAGAGVRRGGRTPPAGCMPGRSAAAIRGRPMR